MAFGAQQEANTKHAACCTSVTWSQMSAAVYDAAVLDDGLLDVAYVMNYPGEQVPGLLKELMRGREEGDELELMDCFGSMRVKWLEVHCADGLQVGTSCLFSVCKHTVLTNCNLSVISLVVSGFGELLSPACVAST